MRAQCGGHAAAHRVASTPDATIPAANGGAAALGRLAGAVARRLPMLCTRGSQAALYTYSGWESAVFMLKPSFEGDVHPRF